MHRPQNYILNRMFDYWKQQVCLFPLHMTLYYQNEGFWEDCRQTAVDVHAPETLKLGENIRLKC